MQVLEEILVEEGGVKLFAWSGLLADAQRIRSLRDTIKFLLQIVIILQQVL